MPSSRNGGARSSTDSVSNLDHRVPGAYPSSPNTNASPYATNLQSLSHAVHARRAEFTRPKRIRIKIGTWNVAALKGTEKDIGPWFVGGKGIEAKFAGLGIDQDDAQVGSKESVEEQERRRSKKTSTIPRGDAGAQPKDEEIGLYVLGLQEIVDVTSVNEAIKPYTDPAAANRYKTELEYVLPKDYVLVAERQLIGMLLLVYAAPDVAAEVSSVSTTSVGTGLMGYMGNKGAVTARIVLGESTRLVFLNSHLSAGSEKASVDRRNWDASQISMRTRFDPIEDTFGLTSNTGERIGEEDFAFWFGDLNYRINAPGDDVRRLLMLHARNEYDLSRPPKTPNSEVETEIRRLEHRSTDERSASQHDITQSITDAGIDEESGSLPPEQDPASLETILLSLLQHDELHAQMTSRKAFHEGWQEAPIRFLPTYKYDVGSVGVFDSSDKRRGPSWCDRILYRTRTHILEYKRKIAEEEQARKRDAELKAKGVEDAANEDDVLFDYNPDDDADEEYDEGAEPEVIAVMTKTGDDAEIIQEYYNAHQRVLSSDHKPLDAIFILTYDAVVPSLKAKIHAEVAKELDRAENEGRPTVTVVADKVHGEDEETTYQGLERGNREGIDFGRVRFREGKSRNVTIANTGQVPATMFFANRPAPDDGDVEAPSPSWLGIDWDHSSSPLPPTSPTSSSKSRKRTLPTREVEYHTLDPGEACNVTLSVNVEALEAIAALNEGSAVLDDILILRVQEGRDHFLPVTGKWVRRSLDRGRMVIANLTESAVRKLQGQSPAAS